MSDLLNALHRLMSWFESHAPEKASRFQPGLSVAEIGRIIKPLNFNLPDELYTLYQWHNGLSTFDDFEDFYGGYTFLPLEAGMEEHAEFCEPYEIISKDDRQVTQAVPDLYFPFLQFQLNYFAVRGDMKEISSSPVYDISNIYEITQYYDSLHGMILTIIECYESGIYTIDQGYPCDESYDREEEIRLKYNPGSVAE